MKHALQIMRVVPKNRPAPSIEKGGYFQLTLIAPRRRFSPPSIYASAIKNGRHRLVERALGLVVPKTHSLSFARRYS